MGRGTHLDRGQVLVGGVGIGGGGGQVFILVGGHT